MNTVRARKPKFRLGDWVTFRYGVQPVFAQVIEDRGPLGRDRRRLYRIRIDWDFGEPAEFEMPEDEMEKAVPDRAAILDYLKQGGLIAILRTNLQGGRNQPRLWLTYNARGEFSYTFEAERGLIGRGDIVPFWALDLNSDQIRLERKSAVLDYLSGFGLTREEAENVVESVGTSVPDEIRPLHFR